MFQELLLVIPWCSSSKFRLIDYRVLSSYQGVKCIVELAVWCRDWKVRLRSWLVYRRSVEMHMWSQVKPNVMGTISSQIQCFSVEPVSSFRFSLILWSVSLVVQIYMIVLTCRILRLHMFFQLTYWHLCQDHVSSDSPSCQNVNKMNFVSTKGKI